MKWDHYKSNQSPFHHILCKESGRACYVKFDEHGVWEDVTRTLPVSSSYDLIKTYHCFEDFVRENFTELI